GVGGGVGGEATVCIGLGGNLVAAIPDTEIAAGAMRRLNLTVGINTKLNRGHLVHGRKALILPCLGRTELDEQAEGPQMVTIEDSTCVVQASAGRNRPASPHLLSEPAIIAGMARATLPKPRIDWEEMVANYDRIRDAIEVVFPIFKDFNKRVRKPGGFHLESTARNRVWNTPTGKANFLVFTGIEEDPHRDDPDVLWLTTIRSHDQFNTTVYALNDRYRGVYGQRRVLFPRRGGKGEGQPRPKGVGGPQDRLDRRHGARRPPIQGGAVQYAKRCLRRLLPGNQRTGPALQPGWTERHTDVQVGSYPDCSQRDRRSDALKGPTEGWQNENWRNRGRGGGLRLRLGDSHARLCA